MRILRYTAPLMLLFLLGACGRGAPVIPTTPTPFVPSGGLTATAQTEQDNAAATQAAASPDEPTEVAAASIGDLEAGQQLFNTMYAEAGFACATCHDPNTQNRLIGPGLQGIGEIAATRVEGQTAEEYLHDSIVDPNAYLVEGDPEYPENLMPQIYNDLFTEEEINNLVAYLLTL